MGVQITSRRRSLMFVNIMITSIAMSLLMTALNTALTPITKDLGVSISTGQWLSSGYTLAMGIIMPLTSFLVRRIPTKTLYLSGLICFIIGLLLAMFAGNFPILMAGRIFQACGNGVITTMTQVVILSIYPIEQRGTAMGWYGLSVSAAPVFAPTLGGILTDAFGWRSIFGIVLIVIVISLVMAFIVFANVLDTDKIKLDMTSFILSVFAFGGITLGVGNLANYGLTDVSVWVSLIVGIVAAVLFVRRQLRIPEPFLDVSVFRFRGYTISVISVAMLYAITMGATLLIPIYVQSGLGHSATFAGLIVLPGALINAIISPLAGRLYDKINMKRIFIPASIMMLLSTLGFFILNENMSVYMICVFDILRCISFGALSMTLITWGTSFVKPTALADASALMTAIRTIGGALGSAVLVGIMNMFVKNSGTVTAESYLHGFNMTFLWLTILPLVLMFFAFFLVKDHKAPVSEEEVVVETTDEEGDEVLVGVDIVEDENTGTETLDEVDIDIIKDAEDDDNDKGD